MVSKNNFQYKQEQEAHRIPHYGLRKLSIGVASVLLSTSLYLGISSTAQAATNNESNEPVAASTNADHGNTGSSQLILANQSSAQPSSEANNVSAATSLTSKAPSAASAESSAASGQAAPAQPADASSATPQAESDSSLQATLSDGATVSISRNTIGADGNSQTLKVTISFSNAKKGDQYILTMDRGTAYEQTNAILGQRLSINGTTDVSGNATQYIITDTITSQTTGGTTITQTAELGPRSNAFQMAVTEIGEMVKHVTFTKIAADGTRSEATLNFTQIIAPEVDPQLHRIKPSGNAGVLPNVDYTYGLSIGNTDGVAKGTWGGSARINSAINTDTTITVPVPENFVLNQELTDDQPDRPDISQPGGMGHDVIIHVAKGQGGFSTSTPYYIVGHYVMTRPTHDTQVKASRKITVDETITRYDGSTYHLIGNADPWTETIAGDDSKPSTAIFTNTHGYVTSNSAPSDLPLTADTRNPLVQFEFGNPTVYSVTNGHITLTFPDGLNINRISTPNDRGLFPGTTSYQYSATLSNGETVTGTVAAGQSVTRTDGTAIRQIVFTPNYIASGAGADQYTAFSPTTAFQAYGSIDQSLADGTELDSTITFGYHVVQNGTTVDATSTSTNRQAIQLPITNFGSYKQQNSYPGTNDAGYISVMNNGHPKTTDYVHEPIFYYVLPTATEFAYTTQVQGNPKITVSFIDGHQVVKFDYTGTNFDFNTTGGANTQVHLNNLPLAADGSYPCHIYVYSPTTKVNTWDNPLATTIPDYSSDYTDHNSENVYSIPVQDWYIATGNEAGNRTAATGNENNGMMVTRATSDDKGNGQLTMHFKVQNHQPTDLEHAVSIINISNPDIFHLTGPLTADGATSAEILYSTSAYQNTPTVTLSRMDSSNLDDYVPAGSVTDWSQIKSIAFLIPHFAANTSTPVFTINGFDPTLANDAGKTVGMETYFFADDVSPIVVDADTNASIKITGQSTIRAEVVNDATGAVAPVDLSNLTHTYHDNQDTMNQADFALTDANKTAVKNVVDQLNNAHDGYVYSFDASQTPTIQNGKKTWATDADNGTAAFGQQVKYYFDDDMVQYHITRQRLQSITYRIIDQTTGDVLLRPTSLASGTDGANLTQGEKDTYNHAAQHYLDQGYVLVSQDTLPQKFGTGDQELTITLAHGVATITPDTSSADVPSNSDVQPSDLTKTAQLTVQYQNADGTSFTGTVPSNASQTVNLTGTAYVDKVTGHLTNQPTQAPNGQDIVDTGNHATPSIQWTTGSTTAVTSPDETGYTADQSSVPALNITVGDADSGLEAGNSVVIGKDSSTVQISRTVNYTAQAQHIDYQIVDDTDGGAILTSGRLADGHSNENVPASASTDLTAIVNNFLNEGYVQSGNYTIPATFSPEGSQTVIVHLTHGVTTIDPSHTPGSKINPNDPRGDRASTYPAGADQQSKKVTRTINFSGAGSQTPVPITQDATFNATGYIDKVTGHWIKSANDFTQVDGPTWNGNGDLSEVVPPVIAGYHVASISRDNDGTSKVKAVTVNHDTDSYTVDVVYAKQATAQVVYVDADDGNRVIDQSPVLTGNAGEQINYSSADTISRLENQGYVLFNNGFDPDGTAPVFDADNTPLHQYVITLGHKSVIVTPDQPKTPSDPLPDNPSQNYPAGVGENDLNKTVTRTINLHQPDGSVVKVTQEVHLTRTATVDEVNGHVTYSDWTTGNWPQYDVPSIEGYVPTMTTVDAQTVDADTADTTVDVYYHQQARPVDPQKPDKPDQPNNPDQPSNPSQPAGPVSPTQPGQREDGHNSTTVTKNSNDSSATNAAKKQAARLPQTGDQNSASLIGLGLASLLSLLGLSKRRREN